MESTKKKGYKKWADDFGYEDFDDDDKKYEFEKELGYIKYDIKSTQLWLNASKELSKKLSEIETQSKGYEEAMRLVDEYKDQILTETQAKEWELDDDE